MIRAAPGFAALALLHFVGDELVAHHHRDEQQARLRHVADVGAALVEIEQLRRLALAVDAVERAGHPVGDEEVIADRLDAVEIADRRAIAEIA